mgnify:CR=1 FL=1
MGYRFLRGVRKYLTNSTLQQYSGNQLLHFDHMDDYICEKILLLDEESHQNMNRVVAECASRTLNQLAHMGIEPGTETAFRAFIAALHQMYLMGIAIELKALGYHMTQLS